VLGHNVPAVDPNLPGCAVDYLYSLYDALVSINVPTDKARAVVDAMERDMGTSLATKADLHQLRAEMGQEFALVRRDIQTLESGVRKDLGALESGLRKDLETLDSGLRNDFRVVESGLRKDMQSVESGLRKDLELLSVTMTVRLGSMLVVGLGVLFAALKLT
jgi:hypothetical protein